MAWPLVFRRRVQTFKGRHFDQSVILLCVRWYLAYGLSLRDLKEMLAERGIRSIIRRSTAGSFTSRPCC
jgi:transposase-like protein